MFVKMAYIERKESRSSQELTESVEYWNYGYH